MRLRSVASCGRTGGHVGTRRRKWGDGWMSSESANVYETSTETLFLGRQDAMQRQALLPLSEHARDPTAKPLKRILEVSWPTLRLGS